MTRPFAVLDRDGTIIEERHYLSRPEQVELIPGVGGALGRLSRLGLGLVVLTNQSAVGRGLFDLDQLNSIHRRMEELLAAEGVHLAGIYVCPHLPDDGCCCRKPLPGLLEEAARQLGFRPQEAFFIGDKPCDVDLGRRVGAATFLLRTGHGGEYAPGEVPADYVVDDLPAAVTIIERMVAEGRREGSGFRVQGSRCLPSTPTDCGPWDKGEKTQP